MASRRNIKAAVLRKIAAARLDQILVAAAKRNLDEGVDADGKALKVLQDVKGEWTDQHGVKRTTTRWRGAGDQPMLDTRTNVYNRLSGVTRRRINRVELVLRGPLLAAYHLEGFETEGPNFIPLTLAAKRRHKKGSDPATEGLIEGRDYVMAWNGVSVPSRRFFGLTDKRMHKELARGIAAALKR